MWARFVTSLPLSGRLLVARELYYSSISARRAPDRCTFPALLLLLLLLCSPFRRRRFLTSTEVSPCSEGGRKKSGFAVVSPLDFTDLFPARGFIIALLTLFTNSPKWRTRTSTSRSCWRKETASTRPSYTP